jgi:hypothetical protein
MEKVRTWDRRKERHAETCKEATAPPRIVETGTVLPCCLCLILYVCFRVKLCTIRVYRNLEIFKVNNIISKVLTDKENE